MNYRKIYEQHHGKIPKDNNGRSMEIHHINGNHSDNRIENLQLVTIEEHFQIHYNQGDWAACFRMAKRMTLTPQELSSIASKSSKQRTEAQIKAGTHPFQNSEIQKELCMRQIERGTHPFLGGELQRQLTRKRLADGTHNFLGPDNQNKKLKNGSHNFQVRKTCPHCNRSLNPGNYKQYHGDNCKMKH